MTSQQQLRQITLNDLLTEIRTYLDGLQRVPWDVNLGIAIFVYDSSNFGLVTNSIPKSEPLTDQFMSSWSRYRHCEATTHAISRAYDRYLDDEEGEDYDFDRTVYESMLEALGTLKSEYDLQHEVFAKNFFWAIRFADPTPKQEEFTSSAFQELNSKELFSQFRGLST